MGYFMNIFLLNFVPIEIETKYTEKHEVLEYYIGASYSSGKVEFG